MLTVAFILSTSATFAATKQVNTVIAPVGVEACIDGTASCIGPRSFGFTNPNITVTYKANIKNADTGEIIPQGGVVPKGTRVTLECTPRQNTDISWFVAGGIYDSPYGRWVPNLSQVTTACTPAYFVARDIRGGGTGRVYGTLAVPQRIPAITTGSLTSCTTLADGCSQTCTAGTVGSTNVSFSFPTVNASFFGSVYITNGVAGFENKCSTSRRAMAIRDLTAQQVNLIQRGTTKLQQAQLQGRFQGAFGRSKHGDTTVEIPPATIAYPLTIADGGAPGAASVSGKGACVTGSPYTITISGADPQSGNIRYGIDWDNNGSIDAWAPTTSYNPSGTQQTAGRTFVSDGQKTIRVLVQNADGVSSQWKTLSFECSEFNTITCPLGYVQEGNTCTFNACPSGYQRQGAYCVQLQCPSLYCVGNDLYKRNDSCQSSFVQACAPGVCSVNACVDALPPVVTWEVKPEWVLKGEKTVLNWNAVNVASCRITGTDGFESTNFVGTNIERVIEAETVFRLSCEGLGNYPAAERSTTVHIAPIQNED